MGSPCVTSRANVLLWADSTAAYLDAIKAAGLADRVEVETLPRKERPSADQIARTQALMAYTVPAGLLPAMPELRWAQVMTAGVEEWLALPDLPPDLVLTCARGTHAESMPENIIGALLYVAKPYAAAVANQKRGTWVRTVAQPLTDGRWAFSGSERSASTLRGSRRSSACGGSGRGGGPGRGPKSPRACPRLQPPP